jgi:uncharacterized protein (TIGR03435 family)
MKRLLTGVFLIWAASAQQSAFDAVSVKQNHSTSNGMGGTIGIKNGGALSMRNVPVRELIAIAYGIVGYQLSKSPTWTDTVGYDIEAKPEKPVDRETAKLMFQNLLAERFHLRVHHETTTVAGFHLMVDKGGSRLKVSEATGIGFRTATMEEIRGPADTPMLARYLTLVLHAPVEDHTCLTGKYDMEVKWTPDNGASANAEPGPDLFMALRQQLGLNLEKVNMAIDQIVIDNVERPTEN